MMSTELTTIGPLCQAAIVTFQPFTVLTHLMYYFVITFALLKLVASAANALLMLSALPTTQSIPANAQKLAIKYHFPLDKITIINSSLLAAFTSYIPFISNSMYFSRGVFRKLGTKAQEAVFLHELHHWKHKDAFRQLISSIVTEVFFFVPSLRDIRQHWQLKAEMAADAFAISELQSDQPLKQALKQWLSQEQFVSYSNRSTSQYAPSWSITFGETQLSQRFNALGSSKLLPKRQRSNATLPAPFIYRLVISCVVIISFIVATTHRIAQVEATFIIPTSSQCSQIWQQAALQSSVDQNMSHQ